MGSVYLCRLGFVDVLCPLHFSLIMSSLRRFYPPSSFVNPTNERRCIVHSFPLSSRSPNYNFVIVILLISLSTPFVLTSSFLVSTFIYFDIPPLALFLFLFFLLCLFFFPFFSQSTPASNYSSHTCGQLLSSPTALFSVTLFPFLVCVILAFFSFL